MAKPISSIPNLRPASQAAFSKAGIYTAEDLRAIGADEGYRRLLLAGTPPHFIGYYVLVMALQGRPWNDCRGDEKAALRQTFDTLKAEVHIAKAKGRSDIETAIQFFGVIERGKGTNSF